MRFLKFEILLLLYQFNDILKFIHGYVLHVKQIHFILFGNSIYFISNTHTHTPI